MTLDRAGLRQLDGLVWATIAAVAAAVLAALLLSDFRLAWASFLAPAATATLFAAGQWFYRTRRPDPRLAAALGSTAQIVAFAAVGAPLSYLAASLNFPLTDHWFEAADRALGFDWFGLFDWLSGHATAGLLLRMVYISLMPQTLVVILALSLAGHLATLRIFVLAFVLAALLTIAMSAIWPAQGVWLQHGLTASDGLHLPVSATSWPVFLGLRDSTFRLLMAGGAEGIITFPSLHAALALILAAAFWPLPVLRWIGAGLNAIMMLSIPVDGSHYFTDILAGIGIAVVCLLAARAMVQRANQPHPALAATPLQELATTSRP
ncbi:MAG: phosphatase PAP2 family protein [Rhizobiales bacterium]|nr:phosphatase PAP2 family protein [Hyphomicrobiales bacterium]